MTSKTEKVYKKMENITKNDILYDDIFVEDMTYKHLDSIDLTPECLSSSSTYYKNLNAKYDDKTIAAINIIKSINKERYTCHYCDREFNSKQLKYRHRQTCDEYIIYSQQELNRLLLESMGPNGNKRLEELLKEKDRQMKKIMGQFAKMTEMLEAARQQSEAKEAGLL